MKRKKVFLIVGVLLVFMLTGTLGSYSAWGSPKLGLTYRWKFWEGVRIQTDWGVGAEVLFYYRHWTREEPEFKRIKIGLSPSLTYHFRGSSNTSPYLGVGYHSWTDKGENSTKDSDENTRVILLAGIEHFLNKNFSCDLRITSYLENWKEIVGTRERQGKDVQIIIDLGLSIFL